MTFGIFVLFVLPLAFVAFALGILCGLWLSGALYNAPVMDFTPDEMEFQASEGARFADSLLFPKH